MLTYFCNILQYIAAVFGPIIYCNIEKSAIINMFIAINKYIAIEIYC